MSEHRLCDGCEARVAWSLTLTLTLTLTLALTLALTLTLTLTLALTLTPTLTLTPNQVHLAFLGLSSFDAVLAAYAAARRHLGETLLVVVSSQ